MSDPMNVKRAGELWDPHRVAVLGVEIHAFKDVVTVSGGWAWHFLSRPEHVEFKMTHDHKDLDLFVEPERASEFLTRAQSRGYGRSWTRFDGKTKGFSRYERTISGVKVIVDLFLEKVPGIAANEGILVVEPVKLLSFYGQKHSSVGCHAVRAAREIVARGEVVLNHPALTPAEDKRVR